MESYSDVMNAYSELTHQNMIGVAIAVTSNAVIPLALNLQKYAHTMTEAEEGPTKTPVTRRPIWWLGILLMAGACLQWPLLA